MDCQVAFRYTDKELDSLDLTISKDRLGAYLRLAKGNRKKAIQFYELNNSVSEALFGVIRGAEIALRNSIHNVLTAELGKPDWYDHLPFLGPWEKDSIAKAKDSIRKRNKKCTPGRVIAELTLGFWCGITSKKYDSRLWVPNLHKAFPHCRLGRKKANARLEQIRRLRNSIAHHECILHVGLARKHSEVLETVGWICPDTLNWVEANSTFEARLKELANLIAENVTVAVAEPVLAAAASSVPQSNP